VLSSSTLQPCYPDPWYIRSTHLLTCLLLVLLVLLLLLQSLLSVTASDTKAKDRDLAHGVLATPLTINGCGFVPQVSIADIRVTASKQFNWNVEKLASPESLSLKYDQQGLVK
jgi:hypothetical protein